MLRHTRWAVPCGRTAPAAGASPLATGGWPGGRRHQGRQPVARGASVRPAGLRWRTRTVVAAAAATTVRVAPRGRLGRLASPTATAAWASGPGRRGRGLSHQPGRTRPARWPASPSSPRPLPGGWGAGGWPQYYAPRPAAARLAGLAAAGGSTAGPPGWRPLGLAAAVARPVAQAGHSQQSQPSHAAPGPSRPTPPWARPWGGGRAPAAVPAGSTRGAGQQVRPGATATAASRHQPPGRRPWRWWLAAGLQQPGYPP